MFHLLVYVFSRDYEEDVKLMFRVLAAGPIPLLCTLLGYDAKRNKGLVDERAAFYSIRVTDGINPVVHRYGMVALHIATHLAGVAR